MAFSHFSSLSSRSDAKPLLSQSSASRSYLIPMINFGVIGLLLYLWGARLNGKALTVTLLEWEDCGHPWRSLHQINKLIDLRCFLSFYCAYHAHPEVVNPELLIFDLFCSWVFGTRKPLEYAYVFIHSGPER